MSIRLLLLTTTLLLPHAGCALPGRMFPQPVVFDHSVSKEHLVAHLNRNIVGTANQGGIVSWQTHNARLHVTGIPAYLPASIAVEAPRNFRMLVSNPMTGGQEVDIGSNPERFWMWNKQSPELMTVRHEDVPLALQHIPMPVHIHPDWLIEAMGVIPLNPDEFAMGQPRLDTGEVDLVAVRKSPLGQDMERVIRVDLSKGEIREHVLRIPGGSVVARARMTDYKATPNGARLAHKVKLFWPEAKMAMTMNLGSVDVNPPALAGNSALWKLPHIPGAHPVDIGAIARIQSQQQRGAGPSQLTPPPASYEFKHEQLPGRTSLPDSFEEFAQTEPSVSAPASAHFPDDPFAVQPVSGDRDETPAWARPASLSSDSNGGQTTKVTKPETEAANPFAAPTIQGRSATEDGRPSAYSSKASRSSWDQLPPGQE